MAPKILRLCCDCVRWFPVIFISAIVVWSYYAYVVQMCIFAVDSIAEKVLYLLLYHPIFVLFVWSYGKTIFMPLGKVPPQVNTWCQGLKIPSCPGPTYFTFEPCRFPAVWVQRPNKSESFYLSAHDADRMTRERDEEIQKSILINAAKDLPILNRTNSGAPRYCEKCKCIKPDRCHHCSVCGQCVLKMDHHCPWVNNCVGFTNYKFFVLFLGYALLYCLFIALSSLQYFIQFWSGNGSKDMGRFHVLFLFFVSVMFGISLISLFGYHCYLTANNRSTLESFRSPVFQTGPDKNGFSLGKYNNFTEVFGEDKKMWFLPISTSESDGVSFPTRNVQANSNTYQTMGQTPSAGDGVNFPTRTIDLDSDGLLADRQRWMEEGELDGAPGVTAFRQYGANQNGGYDMSR